MSSRRRSRGKRRSRISRWRSELTDDDDDDIVEPTPPEPEPEPQVVVATSASIEAALEAAVDAVTPRPPVLPTILPPSAGAVVEAIAETSQAMTKPTELVPTASEIAVMALAQAVPADEPDPVVVPKTMPPRPPPGAPLLVVQIPPKAEVVDAVEVKPAPTPTPAIEPPTRRRRPRIVMMSAAVAFVGIAVAIGSVMWARGEVARARAQNTSEPMVIALNGKSNAALVTPQPTAPAIEPAPVVAPAALAPAPVVAPVASAPVIEPVEAKVETKPEASAVATTVETKPEAKQVDTKPETVATKPVDIQQRAAARTARPKKAQTEVTINSNPPGADVVINGRKVGSTPLVAKVDRNKQATIWFHRPGMTSDWRRIMPKTEKAAVHLAMTPAR